MISVKSVNDEYGGVSSCNSDRIFEPVWPDTITACYVRTSLFRVPGLFEARVGSGKFSLKMCSKSGKLSAEIGIQCGKPNLKMLPVRTDFVDGQIRSPIPLSCCK